MGREGVLELVKFVEQGGTLITEGSTATIFPAYGITSTLKVEEPGQLFVRGSILRGSFTDRTHPIAYGYDAPDLPVYFDQAPVISVVEDQRAYGSSGSPKPKVILRVPASADDILLSGSLSHGEQLAGRALLVDQPLGAGHIVMFALRPFWRAQTHGAFSLVFNAILNWNDF
jgi:hypothetical protein